MVNDHIERTVPLSGGQQALWFLEQLEPGSAIFGLPMAVQIRGLLDKVLLERSLNEVVRRHGSLRTTFGAVRDQPLQVVHPTAQIPLAESDLTGLPVADRMPGALQILRELVHRPFDLGAGPLMRAVLVRLGDTDHLLLLCLHQIICDDWSLRVLQQEIGQVYAAFATGAEPALPVLPCQYADHARWEHDQLQAGTWESQVAYWKEQLGSDPPVLNLPTDRLRPPVQNYGAGSCRFELPRELVAALDQLSRQEDVPLSTTLLGAFMLLLFRYTGQADLLVGTAVPNRRPEVGGLIGPFANWLAVRADLSDAPGFRQLLRRLHTSVVAAEAHSEVPFERIVQGLQFNRTSSSAPLYQVAFRCDAEEAPQQAAGLTLQGLPIEADQSLSDLALAIVLAGEKLQGSLQYSTALFDEATVRRMVGHWQLLLEGIAGDADQSVTTLRILTSAEQGQLAVWSQGMATDPTNILLPDLVEAWARRTPDAVAVEFGHERLTYRELNERANQLAHDLRRRGVGPEVLVGVCAERCPEMIVGLLGVLKAGGAYVPLDPTYPAERLTYMLTDAAAPVLLTQAHLVAKLPAHTAQIVLLDADWEKVACQPTTTPDANVTTANLVYVIYTSGSTGWPKGVQIEHGSFLSLLCGYQETFHPTPLDRHSQLAGPSFDASIWEIWPPLVAGATLVIVPDAVRLSPPALREWLVEQRVTVSFVPTPLGEAVLELEWPATTPLRVLHIGGSRLHSRPSPTIPFTVFNVYGPTENTILSAMGIVSAQADGSSAPHIGRPSPNVEIFVLDANLQPVPAGVPGELYLGGRQLARGYLNQPELTRERFIQHPFRTDPAARLYRTGDLVRYRPDGNLEFIGRTDDQVKIRGFRIEPGEIESVLGRHPAVQEAVVLAREDQPGEKNLVAYLVPASAVEAADLRTWLKQRLPDYMIPSHFVLLGAIPLTVNGKVNRTALPVPERNRAATGSGSAPPASPLEQMLAGIWCEVLGLPAVGIHDDFFELGGHSLQVTRVASRIRETLAVELPLSQIFEARTVAQLAEKVGDSLTNQVDSFSGQAILPAGRTGRLPLSSAQQRLWFLNQLEPGLSVYNIPEMLRLRGRLQFGVLQRCLGEIVERHEALRTTFRNEGGEPEQIIAPVSSLPLPLALVDLTDYPADEREVRAMELVQAEARTPFDLARGPLFRATLYRLADEEHLLLLNVHHIVADGWSMQVLLGELTSLYAAFMRGEPSSLPALPVQYVDFAVWQRQWLQSAELERQRTYWRRQLEGAPAMLNMPADRPRPAVPSYRGGVETAVLPGELLAALAELGHREGATLFSVLLAAFQALLFRYTGQADLVVGSPIANRNRLETEQLIGFFANTLALRTSLAGNETFRELAHRAQETTLGATIHQDLPFQELVAALQPDRDISYSPIFQVMFALQNTHAPATELPGLTISPIYIHNGTAKFDLLLSMEEGPTGLSASLEYSTDLFDAPTITRMLGHYRTLLEGAVANPDLPLGDLPLLTAAEKQQVLVEWNDTAVDYPDAACVHHLVEAQATRTPTAVAVEFEGESLTYRELNERANQLAHHLRTLAIGPEVLVGIATERSLEMVVGLLGILKAGGAYVPLDPGYPRERLAYMLADSGVAVLLTQQRLVAQLPEHQAKVVCLDDHWAEIARQPQENLASETGPDNLAYVIYTSGSTGKPKGAMNHHRGVCNRLLWMQEEYRLNESDRVLQKTPFSFDVSVWEFFWPLITGARLVVARPDGHKDPAYLVDLIDSAGITTLHFVPPMLQVFLESVGPEHCRKLRRVICSGEALPYDLQERFFSRLDAELHNLYGPTEAAVDVTYWACRRGSSSRTVPIGRPVANTRIYILDDHRQPVPMGVGGELYIGGVQVGRGYLGRPELTAERFIRDPFSADPGARLYRTGDLSRWLPDGTIEYLGRIDHQVKIRGFRIELGEIEATLARHPEVREAVVIDREDVPGDRRLVAYVVPGRNATEADDPVAEPEQSEQVAQWQILFDNWYARDRSDVDPSFNTIGWNSSYTNAPIPTTVMGEWLESTVERIRSLAPRRVLEIGCGSGMLLARLAPYCDDYYATDFSQGAVDYVRDQLVRPNPALSHVHVERRTADDFTGFAGREFDAVILNSVVQYFPRAEYLAKVLRHVAAFVQPGGFIFIGDVRSLPLQPVFHTSVEFFRAPRSLTLKRFQSAVGARLTQDNELVLDPRFFHALALDWSRISHVETRYRRERCQNELTRFRYDAILHVEAPEPVPVEQRLDWASEIVTLGSLQGRLAEGQSRVFGITGIPNARVASDLAISELVGKLDGASTVGDLAAMLQQNGSPPGIDPENVQTLGQKFGYAVEILHGDPDRPDCYDAVFMPVDLLRGLPRAMFPACSTTSLHTPSWRAYASQPHQMGLSNQRRQAGSFSQPPHRVDPSNQAHQVTPSGKLVSALRHHLQDLLPEYMVPTAFVLLDAIPLTVNGKVDRRALPAFDQDRSELATDYVEPRTPIEQAVARIFATVLKVDRIGAGDNFFELGGHSLLATQVISRVRASLQVDLPVRSVFEAPTLAQLAQRIENAQRKQKAPLQPIDPVPRTGPLALSLAQQRLWFLDQLEPGLPLYNIVEMLRLRGRLQFDVLQRCLGEIVQRHEALRTTFRSEGGEPEQIIAPASSLPLPLALVDLTDYPADEREVRATEIVQAEAGTPFDLARGPLFRATLYRLADEEHLLLLNVHHIVADGWSIQVLLGELTSLYAAFMRGEPSSLPALPVQYVDFAVWQRQWLQSAELERQLTYWRKQLEGAPAMLNMPADRPRPAVPSYRGGVEKAVLPGELLAALTELGRREGATLFSVLLAAFNALLFRYTGQEDLVVGSPIANRNRLETEGMIGFFVNTLALRTSVAGNPTFRELVHRAQETALDATMHQDLPFQELVAALHPDRNISYSPIFQVMFALQNPRTHETALPGVAVSPMFIHNRTAKFDLVLSMEERPTGLSATFEYSTDLFDAPTIKRLVGHFTTLLERIAANPDQRVGDLPLVTEAEALFLQRWNETVTDYPRQEAIHRLFEAQAARTPAAVAVVYGAEQITYGELNDRANRLARRLRRLGVGPDQLVGIYMERSIAMIEGLLGILKAGGSYLPLDLAYPKERLAFMLEDGRAPVLLTQESLLDALPESQAEVVCLDRDRPAIATEDGTDLDDTAGPEQLAYVIYTSGSTGVPKGVAVPHRAVVRLVRDTDYVALTAADRIAQASNASFDAATFEIWGALLNGARLVGAGRETVLSPADLAAFLKREAITVLFQTTALFNQMAAQAPGCFAGLRYLLFGGEACDPNAVRSVLRSGAPAHLLHVYGPTENTTFTTWHKVVGVPEGATTVPIGRPLANTTVHVLDGNRRAVPVGLPGELCTGGDGLARGYLNRPELTAERFVQTEWGRLYRTGDLVRQLPDGAVEFIGRIDNQVKIRGFRIEPGEVEARLLTHPGVAEAVVVVREDRPGEKRLAGYVVSRGELGAAELRTWLKEQLPDYMVPSALVMLNALPLTPNGKVNRSALPAPASEATRAASSLSTPIEEALAVIWCSVLGLERVDADANFFEIGGHSLLATQVISRVRESFSVDLPVRSVFEAPTLAQLAQRIADAQREQRAPLPPIGVAPQSDSLPLSFAQQQLWFLDQLDPGSVGYNVPTALRLLGTLNAAALAESLDYLVRRHESLRTVFEPVGGEAVQRVMPPLPVPMVVTDLTGLGTEECEARIVAAFESEFHTPFDLNRGPLFRVHLLRVGAEDHVLIVVMHHIITDGWSQNVFRKELAEVYAAFAEGRTPALPEPSLRYSDFAYWQRRWLQGEVLEQHLAYWRQQLGSNPAPLALPTDRPRPPIQTTHGALVSRHLPNDLRDKLRRFGHDEGATLFMTVLAAFQAWLAYATGQTQVIVGTPLANRTHGETEGLIGFFVNTLPMCADLSDNPTFRAVLQQVRKAALEAYTYQELPFELVVNQMQFERDPSRTPVFQVVFVYEKQLFAEFDLPGLRMQIIEFPVDVAKFDLTLGVREAGGDLSLVLDYNTDLFDAATAERMLSQIQTTLEADSEDPDAHLQVLFRRLSQEELAADVLDSILAED
jgi:pristinamycin I synthase-3/4